MKYEKNEVYIVLTTDSYSIAGTLFLVIIDEKLNTLWRASYFTDLNDIESKISKIYNKYNINSNTPATTAIASTEEITTKRETLDWYTSLQQIRTKTNDPIPASVIIEVVLGYKKDDKATSTEITSKKVEIRDFLRRYFTGKSALELKPDNEEALRIEICNTINDDILSSPRIKDVRFLSLEVIKQ